MRHRCLIPLVLVTVAAGVGLWRLRAPSPASDAPTHRSVLNGGTTVPSPVRPEAPFAKVPLSFEVNRGQFDPRVRFLARGAGYTLFLTPTEAVLDLRHPTSRADRGPRSSSRTLAPPAPGAVVRMRLAGANANPSVTGLEQQPGRGNYYAGSLPHVRAARATGHDRSTDAGLTRYEQVPMFARVRYAAVYPGVDLVYYGNQRQLEYDLVVAPGADPGVIRLQFDGADAVEVDSQGELVLKIPGGEVRQHKPVIYQEVAGVRQRVAGGYVLAGPRQASFVVGEYDRSKPLVLDPVLSYATYLGGTGSDYAEGIAVDSAGNIYVTGNTWSTDFPLTDGTAFVGYADLFITKLNPTGTALVYSTHYHGDAGYYNAGHDIAVDAAGNAYVAGEGAQTGGVGGYAAVIRLNASGVAIYVGLLGYGGVSDTANGIAIDGTGYAYVTGKGGPSFDVTAGAFQTTSGGGDDAFVAKLNTNVAPGVSLVYSTFLGGGLTDNGQKIAIDGAGNAYVTGDTSSVSFPVTASGFQTTYGGGATDAFVSMLSADGSALLYSTYLGGGEWEFGWGIAVDSPGNVYVGGYARGAGFPTTAGSFQPAWTLGQCGLYPNYIPCSDGFVAKINPTLSGTASLVYSTYLGGSGEDSVYSLVIDAAGNAYVAGKAESPQLGTTAFPTVNPIPGFTYSNSDGFVAELNASGSALLFSSYYQEIVKDLAIGSGSLYLSGQTYLTDLIGTAGTYQTTNHGSRDAFIAKIAGVGRARGDFDGDGKADFGVWRGPSGTWYVLRSSDSGATYLAIQWGSQTAGDVLVPGDYDGDGKTDMAVWRPSTGTWFILTSSSSYTSYTSRQWGAASDVPVPGDYDGDGKTDMAVWRPSTGTWYVLESSTGNATYLWVQWGAASDAPVPGDFDGDGKTDPAVWRPSSGTWYVLTSSTNYVSYLSEQWGNQPAGDVTVPGDFDGDGKTDPAVWRPSSGTWYVLTSSSSFASYVSQQWGSASDTPVPGDFDGDGKTDYAVWQPSSGTWYALKSSTGNTAYSLRQWGSQASGDAAVRVK